MFARFGARLRKTATRFVSDREGNVAMMFAAASIPLMLATGGLIDYSRVWNVQTRMQDAADATATMLSQDAPDLTAQQMQTQAQAFFLANFGTQDADTPQITTTYLPYSANGPSVTVKAKTSVPTYFLPLMGLKSMDVETTATAVWGGALLRVSLVLDTTGSMASDGKMDALKVATKKLLDKLKSAAIQDGDVYVSIVPFSKDVNVGASNYNASWIRWDLWEEVNGSCNKSQFKTKSTCVANKKRVWTPANHATWNGCVTDRDQNYDTTNDAPTTTARMFPAEEYDSCSPQLMGLTYDWKALGDKVDALYPAGNTNQAIGLQWGWQTLTASPFTIPPYKSDREYSHVIILLTDGMNTENRWFTSASQIDAREEITCDNIKESGFQIYTVQVNTGKDPKSKVLADCASDPSKTFLLTKADQIVTTFDAIGTQLSQLRISQ